MASAAKVGGSIRVTLSQVDHSSEAVFKRSPRLIRQRTSSIMGQEKPGGDRRISTTQPVSAKSSGVRPTLLVQAKQHLIGLNMTEADYQALIAWCQLTRAQCQS